MTDIHPCNFESYAIGEVHFTHEGTWCSEMLNGLCKTTAIFTGGTRIHSASRSISTVLVF
jgi:hypothetical protein